MGKRKEVEVDVSIRLKVRRGAALDRKVFQSSVSSAVEHLASAENSSSDDEPCDTECRAESVVRESREYQKRLQAVRQVCNAIDEEVKSRSAAIRTLTAAQFSSFKAQLDLQLSKFSYEEQNMPLEELLKTCPGIHSATSADGRIQLQKRSSPYPKLEESKRNLQDLLTNVNDVPSKGANSISFTPCAGPTAIILSITREPEQHEPEKHEPEQKLVSEGLSWPEYYMRLQNLGFSSGLTPSIQNQSTMNTPMIFKGGLMAGVTPKTLRQPKHGEVMLSVNGSPLGQFGKSQANFMSSWQ